MTIDEAKRLHAEMIRQQAAECVCSPRLAWARCRFRFAPHLDLCAPILMEELCAWGFGVSDNRGPTAGFPGE